MFSKNFFFGFFILIGTIIGAGIFGLPYVMAKSGVLVSFFYFLILGGAVLLLHLFYGEIILRTKEKHRLIGYTEKYLGGFWKILISFSVIFGFSGTLLAYLILGGNFLKILSSPWLNLDIFYFTLFFWLIGIYFIFRKIKIIALAEVFSNLIFFLISFFIFFFALPKFNLHNFVLVSFPDIFLPYGVILFAVMGLSAIPEINEVLKTPSERRSYKKIIILATTTTILFYWFFAFIISGVSGRHTSSEVFEGLIPFLGPEVIFFGALAAVITLADSFLIIGLALKNALIYDFKFPKILANFFTVGFPLVLFLVGFRDFIDTIGFIGTFLGIIEGIVIIAIFKKVKTLGDREPEYSLKIPLFLLYLLIGIFIFGAILQFFF